MNSDALNPKSEGSSSTLLISFLNLNILFLLILMVLVMRNVTKLVLERKRGVLGARLKTKLVTAFVAFSFVPTVILFILAWGSVSSTMNKWFSLQIEKSLEESLNVAQIYYQTSSEEVLHFARTVASGGIPGNIRNAARQKQREYKVSALWYFSRSGKELAASISNDIPAGILTRPDKDAIKKALKGEYYTVDTLKKGEVVRGLSPVRGRDSNIIGVVVVDHYIPKRLVKRMREISNSFEEFKQHQLFKTPIKLSYFLLFAMVALLIIFSATWFSFFNSMTADLKAGKAGLEEANRDLESRRQYIEIILGSVAAGVVSLDKTGKITTVNHSAEQLLEIDTSRFIGRNYREILSQEQLYLMKGLIRELNASHEDTLQKEIQLKLKGKTLTVMVSITTLKDDKGNYLGMVIVFDDLTQLIKAQRMAAWREVARRIAHEIKNPLTPIQLSAERLQKRFGDKIGDGSEVFQECTRTIVKQVEELKVLVNEFSNFARMPAANPSPNDINEIAREAIFLFKEAHKGVTFQTELDNRIPGLNLDRDQIKRALINLIDNAVAAVRENGEVRIKTFYDDDLRLARIEVADNGSGILLEDKGRLFEPYFSTKKGGTGLGLVIVNTIVSDHNGYIRVLDNEPKGTRIVIELPVK
ncbi:MAG: Sensor histidine kinase, HAMP and PAS domain-containing [Candidatus Uhrbacteria bacterium GW2011_GWA2_52_8d]|uniref:histidine kinase n=1 Tax=Candidatus Uhrbacteria bacterium GW2011_GWA2_52_8d TaxID=1618979 RepID=A0A0G2AKI9_9BACT|nr:MAG: Sensor histidine kinase, HAMP and PAS domain-containing [Candidatus Uhrbacteria bacterium GW2011_GWA2_52_8d]